MQPSAITFWRQPAFLPIIKIRQRLYGHQEHFTGKSWKASAIIPLFDYFIDHGQQGAFRVILRGIDLDRRGTGIVHTAPAFGEVDFYACQRAGIEPVCPVDNNGRFTEEIPEYRGPVCQRCRQRDHPRLKTEGEVFHHRNIHHRYPFCSRSDTPLIYKAVRTWFVAVEKIKERHACSQ